MSDRDDVPEQIKEWTGEPADPPQDTGRPADDRSNDTESDR